MLALGAVAIPLLALAQEVDDRSRLVRFIESQLSDGTARTVRIDGFRGALSASATLDRLTISDADGVWLTLEDAQLDWSRAEVLAGRIEIQRLSAETLILARPPRGAPAPRSAEAVPFALPDLPLSVSIGAVEIARVDLGAPVLGQAAAFGVVGSASLEDGDGRLDLALTRLDGPRGDFALAAGFTAADRVLNLDLGLSEDAGGIAATLLDLPGAPALDLDIAGTGPLDDFTARIALASDGQPRLTGQVTTAVDQDLRRVDADLGGDITPLLPEAFHGFFGRDLSLVLRAQERPQGGWRVDRLAVAAASLNLEGSVTLDTAGLPEAVMLTGRIADPGQPGIPVRLPLGGAETTITAVDMAIRHDRASGPGWSLTAALTDLRAGDTTLQAADLAINGTLSPDAGGAVSAAITARVDGIDTGDPDLAAAIGPRVDLLASLDWQAGGAVRVTALTAQTATARLIGSLSARYQALALATEFDLRAALPDLAPLSGLAGQDMQGAADLRLTGGADPLSGAFDLTAVGVTRDLSVGAQVRTGLFAGQTDLTLHVIRDTTGLTLKDLRLTGQEVTASATGRLSAETSDLRLTARLRDASLLTPALQGTIALTALATRAGEDDWTVQADLTGVGSLGGQVQGRVASARDLDLAITARLPLGLADPFVAPQSLRGDLLADLTLRGAADLGSLAGTLRVAQARIAVPTMALVLERAALDMRLAGGAATLSASADVSSGGRVQARGQIGLTGAPTADLALDLIDVGLTDPGLFETIVSSQDLRFAGPVASGRLSGTILLGQTDLRIPDPTAGAAEPIPAITHLGETAAQRLTRDRAGLLGLGGGAGTGGPGIALDLTLSAPGRIFLRGRGLDAELGGTLRIGGTSANVLPSGQFDLLRGRLDLLGKRLTFTRGAATLSGSFDPVLNLVAEGASNELEMFVTISGPASAPELGLSSSPDLPEEEILSRFFFGREVANLSAFQALQIAQGVATLTGRGGEGLTARLRNSLGLDDLDISSTETGDTRITAGRYISENVYSNVTVDQGGTTGLSLNIDLSPNVTATGRITTDNSSGIGLFYERDY